MAGPLTNDSLVTDALGGTGCRLASCNASENSLDFRRLQASLQDSGLEAGAEAPLRLCGSFNCGVAAAAQVAVVSSQPAPGVVPQPGMDMALNS